MINNIYITYKWLKKNLYWKPLQDRGTLLIIILIALWLNQTYSMMIVIIIQNVQKSEISIWYLNSGLQFKRLFKNWRFFIINIMTLV